MPFEPDHGPALLRRVLERMQTEMEATLMGAVTSNVAPEQPSLDLRRAIPEWQKMMRNFQRTQITFVIDRAHQGPPLKHETPNDGTRFEMSLEQGCAIHNEWPLKLHKVLSVDAAEFVPLTPLGGMVPVTLPMPPYEMPEPENFEEWLSGHGQFLRGGDADTPRK